MGRDINMSTQCVLYDRGCIGCMECETCDIDADKICDNCGKCLDVKDFATIKIDAVLTGEDNKIK